MVAVYIILGIFTALTLGLCLPVHFIVRFDEALSLKVRVLFFTVDLLKPNPDKASLEELSTEENLQKKPTKFKKKKKHKEVGKNSKLRGIIKKRGLKGFLGILTQCVKIASGVFGKIFSHLRLLELEAKVLLAAEDAADTALLYGRVCAVVVPSFRAIFKGVKPRKYNVKIAPNFFAESSQVRCFLRFYIRPIFILTGAISGAFKIFKAIFLNKKSTQKQGA